MSGLLAKCGFIIWMNGHNLSAAHHSTALGDSLSWSCSRFLDNWVLLGEPNSRQALTLCTFRGLLFSIHTPHSRPLFHSWDADYRHSPEQGLPCHRGVACTSGIGTALYSQCAWVLQGTVRKCQLQHNDCHCILECFATHFFLFFLKLYQKQLFGRNVSGIRWITYHAL